MNANGRYISIWDDGATEVHTDVVIDFDEMCIVEWDASSKTYEGYEPADDGELEHLDEEKVVTAMGVEFTAMSSDDYESFGHADEEAYDNYGNGIIVYNA